MATKAGNPRGTSQWRRVSELVRKRDGYVCVVCGRGRHDGTRLHVDHVVRLADGGAPFDPDNLQTLCAAHHHAKTAQENTRHGDRVRDRYRRMLNPPPPPPHEREVSEPVRVPVLDVSEESATVSTDEPEPTAPGPVSWTRSLPQTRPLTGFDGDSGVSLQSLSVPPRYAPERHPRAIDTHGPLAAAWGVDHLGVRVRPWQAALLDRALEVDESGAWCWPVVVVLTPRQVGKSTVLGLLGAWWADSGLTALHVANRLSTARETWARIAVWAQAQGHRVLRTADQPEIVTDTEHPERPLSPGRYLVQAGKENAGVGFTIDRALVDEAKWVPEVAVTRGLSPAMSSVRNPQTWLFSTAGDAESELLRAYRDRGMTHLHEPDPAVCLVEWSAPETADWQDPGVWAGCQPPPGDPELVDRRMAYLDQQRRTIPEPEFRSEYLNQWVTSADGWVPPTTWEACDGSSEVVDWTPSVAAVEVSLDGRTHHVVTAGTDAAGIIQTGYHEVGTLRELDELLARIGAPTTRVTPAYAGQLRTVYPFIGVRELSACMAATAGVLGRRLVRHPGHVRLTESMLSAVAKVPHTQSGQTLATHGRTPLAPARAWVYAVGLAAADAAPAPRPRVHVRSAH